MRLILSVFFCLVGCASVQAIGVAIYSGTTVVPSQSDVVLDAGLRVALKNVLIKASGDTQLETDPALNSVLGRAASLALRHSYRETTQAAADGSMQRVLLLDVEFDERGVDAILRELGRALWGRERPAVLVWLVIDNNGNKQIASSSQQSALSALLTTADRRGLPVMLPRMDGADLNRVNPVTLWDAPPTSVIGASERYGVDTILVARLQKLGNGWMARYTLIDGREFEHWQAEDGLAAGVLSKAVHGAADRLARRYALDNSGPALGEIQVWVEGLESASDFAKVTGYLDKLPVLHEVTPLSAQSGRLLLAMRVDVGALRFRQLLGFDKLLQLDPVDTAAAESSPLVLRLIR